MNSTTRLDNRFGPEDNENGHSMKTTVLTIGHDLSLDSAARAGADALRDGKLVGFATETVYGLAALATRDDAIATLREVKTRPTGPFSVHLASPEPVPRYVSDIPLRAQWLMGKAWPGPVTLLLETGGQLAEPALQETPGLYETLTQDGVIGLRCPDEPLARAMLAQVDGPVVAPSANPAGAPSPRNAEDVLAGLDGQIDLLIDSGPSRHGRDSSIVRFREDGWELIREGVYDRRMLERMMMWRICFVCTGNTCRSPMAAGLARTILAERVGCDADELEACGLTVTSAGLFASGGSPATPDAIEATARRGADIRDHTSKIVTVDLINQSDLLFCMTAVHRDELLGLGADPGKVYLLDEAGEVPDPIGGDQAVYDRTAARIEQAIRKRLNQDLLI
jgi:tRNA threonylcarbamoyl adenosine modification protein (Sua5/YciO/YrdC/YwlC family)